MKMIVISLGGSQILKNGEVNINFLKKFKQILIRNSKTYKFVIVCGGGSTARIYINGLRKINASDKLQSFVGISITRHHARFMSYFFGEDREEGIPHKMHEIENMLKQKKIIFCGALEYHEKQTSDATSAQIASHLKCGFINITNVSGLYNKNPLEHKDAGLIKGITWKDFDKMANKLSFKPGQHFVLDQSASKIIMRNKIKTYIIGDLKNLDNLLNNRKFIGTIIYG